MSGYILRRIGHMLPTLAGVILLTFLLFHAVGGSPALLVLGEHASPESLETFEVNRGYHLPLFLGYQLRTRAHADMAMPDTVGQWWAAFRTNAVNRQYFQFDSGAAHHIPVAFEVAPTARRCWFVRYRTAPDSVVTWCGEKLPSSDRWRNRKILIADSRFEPFFTVEKGRLDIARVKLRCLQSNPFHSQFTVYISRLLRLDFGRSLATNQRVADMLKAGIGPSLALTVPIFFGDLLISVFLGLVCAFYRGTWIDRGIVLLSVMLMSVNYIVWIVAGQYLFAYRLEWFPIWGFESWRYLLLPLSIGIFSGLGARVRFFRTVMLDEMYRDYVRTAYAKGTGHAGVLFKHVLPNAMIPVITNISIMLPFLYTGSLLLESFFGIPGLGYLSVNAVNSSDVNVVRAVVLIGAVLFMLINLLTDIAYGWADPRVRIK